MTSTDTESVYEILRYLKEHPNARDTAEGIGWWLLDQRTRDCATDVEHALAELLARGLVLELQGMDHRSHYLLNKSRLDEITRMLQRRSHQRFSGV